MGKGDKKTKKGKITIGSYGKRRKRKKTSGIKPKQAEVAAKPKATPKPKVETKEKPASKPKAEVKEKAAPKAKSETKAKAAPKKAAPKAKPKKEKEE